MTMEPTDMWKALFLVFGAILPFAAIAADVIWFGANVIVILICLGWFGFFLLWTEGVND